MGEGPTVCPRVFRADVRAGIALEATVPAEGVRAEPRRAGDWRWWLWEQSSSWPGGFIASSGVEGLALLPYLGGLALLAGGRSFLGWMWPSIAFLVFMVPLPWRIETALGPPLQSVATKASTYLLQTLGFMAFAAGNVVELGDSRINVVEACSGLSMLITFIALSTGVAMIVTRPLLDRIVLVASAIPVALLANVARITLAGVLHEMIGGRTSSTFYHDLAGWVMMPVGLVMYWIVIAILSRLLIEARYEAPPILELIEARRHAVATPAGAKASKHWFRFIRIIRARLGQPRREACRGLQVPWGPIHESRTAARGELARLPAEPAGLVPVLTRPAPSRRPGPAGPGRPRRKRPPSPRWPW